jgi:hypothetical protein
MSACPGSRAEGCGLREQPVTGSDTLTVIRARGRRLAKLIRTDGSIEAYDDAKHFDLFTMRVADLDAVYRLLHRLLYRSDCAVVRGAIADPQHTQQVRRLLYQDNKSGDTPTLCEASRRWLAVDAEGVQRPGRLPATDLLACAAEAVGRLPEAFRGVRCIVQASGSHGIKADIRLRLWFWLNRPTTGQELRRWFHGAPADPSVFGAAQIIYTAAPVVAPRAVDPLPVRLALRAGVGTAVVPPPEALAAPARPNPAPPRLPSHTTAPYVRAALVRAADRIMHAELRHPTIISECRGLARLVHAGLLAESDLRAVVESAAREAGKDDADEIASCIAWGLAHPGNGGVPELVHGRW